MLSWKEIIEKHIIQNCDRIKETTKPLKERFGVNYFTYHKIDKAGNYTVLLDRPDWAEHYVEHEYYLGDPFLRDPSLFESGFTFTENHVTPEYYNVVFVDGKKLFNIDLCIMQIEKLEDAVEFFGYCATPGDNRLKKLYMNHPELLKEFSEHFKQRLNSSIQTIKEQPGVLPKIKGETYHQNEPIKPDTLIDDRITLLKEMGLLDSNISNHTLSKREKECLHLLLKGCSAKETATILKLSPRTIESYFENIKSKLNCYTKADLFQVARKLSTVGLI